MGLYYDFLFGTSHERISAIGTQLSVRISTCNQTHISLNTNQPVRLYMLSTGHPIFLAATFGGILITSSDVSENALLPMEFLVL